MRRPSPLRAAAAGVALASVLALNDETIFAAVGKPPARAARRIKKYDSLSGIWNGAYTYPWSRQSVPFNARLEESAAEFTGEIDEPNTFGDPASSRLFATVRGARAGMTVSFVKRYDGAGGQSHAVSYEGSVNADFTRIDGHWSLPAMTGSFFMERADAGAEAAVSRAASASA